MLSAFHWVPEFPTDWDSSFTYVPGLSHLRNMLYFTNYNFNLHKICTLCIRFDKMWFTYTRIRLHHVCRSFTVFRNKFADLIFLRQTVWKTFTFIAGNCFQNPLAQCSHTCPERFLLHVSVSFVCAQYPVCQIRLFARVKLTGSRVQQRKVKPFLGLRTDRDKILIAYSYVWLKLWPLTRAKSSNSLKTYYIHI